MHIFGVVLAAFYDWCFAQVGRVGEFTGVLIWMLPIVIWPFLAQTFPRWLWAMGMIVVCVFAITMAVAHHNYWKERRGR